MSARRATVASGDILASGDNLAPRSGSETVNLCKRLKGGLGRARELIALGRFNVRYRTEESVAAVDSLVRGAVPPCGHHAARMRAKPGRRSSASWCQVNIRSPAELRVEFPRQFVDPSQDHND